ncbi:dtdp-glucose 4,6-dehydratase [Podospora didyma]|uniref:Dtdp-glucose 4,6-dehydratase n=1 Tax=Podospora didyma TaxID=330526 RepID=A0AAE0JY51_9PEZI|nr:dtdp-glucose 4,6-dehydratase [Podospora didyma]
MFNNTRILNDKLNFTLYQGDITHLPEVVSCLEKHNIDTIFHFAAQSHVDLSFGNSYGFTHTNVHGTQVLLESAKKVGIKRFIHISTDEVYGEVKDDDLLETSILAPTNPYTASKAAAEMLVHSYQESFKLPVIIVRSNDVSEPHQYPENMFYANYLPLTEIIPKFACLLNRGKPVVLHGDGTPTRRYLFAGDAADAFDTILHKGQPGQIYNAGSYDEISNLALCSKLLSEMDLPHESPEDFSSWVKYTHDRPFNDRRYADQKTPFTDGLRITVEWYRRFGEVWWDDISKALSPFPIVAADWTIPSD